MAILYKTYEGCERCEWDEYVPHDRCLYFGQTVNGHSASHCTAGACH